MVEKCYIHSISMYMPQCTEGAEGLSTKTKRRHSQEVVKFTQFGGVVLESQSSKIGRGYPTPVVCNLHQFQPMVSQFHLWRKERGQSLC